MSETEIIKKQKQQLILSFMKLLATLSKNNKIILSFFKYLYKEMCRFIILGSLHELLRRFLSCLSFIPKRSLEHPLNIINCMSFSINTKYTMVYNTNKTSYEQENLYSLHTKYHIFALHTLYPSNFFPPIITIYPPFYGISPFLVYSANQLYEQYRMKHLDLTPKFSKKTTQKQKQGSKFFCRHLNL